MTEFNKTNWANAEFSQEYRDNADIYIVERKRLFAIMRSFYRYFLRHKKQNSILDLGCGDGIVTHGLLEVDDSISATLIDGSEEMLMKAQDRLKQFWNIRYARATFQEILDGKILEQDFDFIVSSLAIHHLNMNEKREFFKIIHSRLKSGGYFLNIDVVLAPTESLDQWYMQLWQEWMDDKRASMGFEDVSFDDIIRRYKDAEENQPDTLDEQIGALRNIGFRDADCFYKYGIFAMYGGRK